MKTGASVNSKGLSWSNIYSKPRTVMLTCLGGLGILATELGSLSSYEGAIGKLDIGVVVVNFPATHLI